MRRNMRWTWIALLAGVVMFFGSIPNAWSAPPAVTGGESVGYLENITFEKLKGKDRIILALSRQAGVNVESTVGNGILVKMKNMRVSEELRRSLGEGKLVNVIRAVPAQKTADGAQWVMIAIDLRQRVPYSVNQQGKNVLIDFNTAALEHRIVIATAAQKTGNPPVDERGKDTKARGYAGRMITLDFQDASIKAVLRLMAEEAGVSIVSGDDVKGKVTVHMKKVPWDQALDTILDINGLTKRQEGNVITVMTLDKMRKDEATRRQAEEERIKAELTAKKAEQERLVEKGRLAQISIEAKIVEATDDFIRNLGVRWGGASYGRAGNYGFGLIGGTNTVMTRGSSFGYPPEVGIKSSTGGTLQSYAVNYPTAIASPTLGLIIGGANAVLEAQLAALESTNQGKVISSPKITTMDNVKATIKQGQEIPYVTIDKDGNRSITFKEAVLRLDVKPTVTPDGRISMEIKASNDAADYAQGEKLAGNPPINKSEVESKIVVQDGDTIAIGGILKTEDFKDTSGVPWLMKIPVLGWLFKTESTTKKKKQLMIFVTPKIMKEDNVLEKPTQVRG